MDRFRSRLITILIISTLFIIPFLSNANLWDNSSKAKNGAQISYPPNASGKDIIQNSSNIDKIIFGENYSLPNQGYFQDSSHEILWFIHITDTQSIWMQWGDNAERRDIDDGRIQAIRYFLNTTQKVIAPLFIVNTGDLVDADYNDYFDNNIGQRASEWAYYNETIREFGLNYTNYFDIMGNHDLYGDPGFTYYLNYSISGNAFGTDQFEVEYQFPWGNYNFYMLSVISNYGVEFPFQLGGEMSKEEINWLESHLLENQNAPTTPITQMAFGHQPLMEVYSHASDNGYRLISMLQNYGITNYFCGHGHVNRYQEIDGLAEIETRKLEDNGGGYRIVAIDGGHIATLFNEKQTWPAGIITTPLDNEQAIGNYNRTEHSNVNHLRCLAWDPEGVSAVQWRIKDTESEVWTPMSHIDGPVYETIIDNVNQAILKDGQNHEIEVKIENILGDSSIKSINYNINGGTFTEWFDYWIYYLIGFIGLVIISPLALLYLRKRPNPRFTKDTRSEVDPTIKKWFLVKIIALVLLPLGLGFFYDQGFTAIFTWFIVGSMGFIYSDVALLFGGLTFLFSIFPFIFTLSPKHKNLRKLLLVPSIFIELLMIIFFFTHNFWIGWLSPAYEVMLYSDWKTIQNSKSKLVKNH